MTGNGRWTLLSSSSSALDQPLYRSLGLGVSVAGVVEAAWEWIRRRRSILLAALLAKAVETGLWVACPETGETG